MVIDRKGLFTIMLIFEDEKIQQIDLLLEISTFYSLRKNEY